MAKANKVHVALLKVEDYMPIDLTKNVRDPGGINTTYDLEGLTNEIELDGRVKVRPVFHFKDGKPDQPIQGFRRLLAVAKLHEKYPSDERWNAVEVEIVHDLTQREIIQMMLDHGNVKQLELTETVGAIWKFCDVDPEVSDKELAVRTQGLLEIHFKAPSADKLTAEQIGAHYRGTIQTMRNMQRLPLMCRPLMMTLVAQRQAVSYRKKDIAALVKIYEEERKADLSGKTNKENPGPAFLRKWEEFVDSEDEKAQKGGTRAKAIASMSKTELDAVADNATSFIVKQLIKLITRALPDSDRKLKLYEAELAKVEKTLDASVNVRTTAIISGTAPELAVPTVTAEEPVAV